METSLRRIHDNFTLNGLRGNYHAALYAADGAHLRGLTNLRWLLRAWKQVERFSVLPYFKSPLAHWDAVLVAHLSDGRMYATAWASSEVMHQWLDRPVFHGLTLTTHTAEGAIHPAREIAKVSRNNRKITAAFTTHHTNPEFQRVR